MMCFKFSEILADYGYVQEGLIWRDGRPLSNIFTNCKQDDVAPPFGKETLWPIDAYRGSPIRFPK